MNILFDTNVLSEVRRPAPEPKVLAWLDRLDEDRAFISVASIAELRRGIALMEEGRRRAALSAWVATFPSRSVRRSARRGQCQSCCRPSCFGGWRARAYNGPASEAGGVGSGTGVGQSLDELLGHPPRRRNGRRNGR